MFNSFPWWISSAGWFSCNSVWWYRASTITAHDRSACHDTKHKPGRRLSSLDMQIPVITITNRAQAGIMESRDCNVRNRHIRDTRPTSAAHRFATSLSLSLFIVLFLCSFLTLLMYRGDSRKFISYRSSVPSCDFKQFFNVTNYNYF